MARDSLSDCTASQEPEVAKKHWGRFEIVRGLTVLVLLSFISGCHFELPRKRFQDIVVFEVLLCKGFLLGFSEASREIICVQAYGESESQSESQNESKSESERES